MGSQAEPRNQLLPTNKLYEKLSVNFLQSQQSRQSLVQYIPSQRLGTSVRAQKLYEEKIGKYHQSQQPS